MSILKLPVPFLPFCSFCFVKEIKSVFDTTRSDYISNSKNPNYDPVMTDALTSSVFTVGGTVATGGTSSLLWGVNTAKDMYSAYISGDYVNTLGPDAISYPDEKNILGQKAGAAWSTINIFNTVQNNYDTIYNRQETIKQMESNNE